MLESWGFNVWFSLSRQPAVDGSGGGISGDVIDGNDNSEEVQISAILCTTKSGRTCRTWKGRYLYY